MAVNRADITTRSTHAASRATADFERGGAQTLVCVKSNYSLGVFQSDLAAETQICYWGEVPGT